MSISAVSGIAQAAQQVSKPQQAPTVNDSTPFGKQMEQQTAQVNGHHHHPHGGAAQSATSLASSASGPTSGSLASSLMQLLS